MSSCYYCLCKYCNKIRCPRGKYHCLPCYHGVILDCKFFQHKKVTRIYRIKGYYRKISEKDLRDLRNTIDKILGDGSVDLGSYSGKSMAQLVKEEEQRHRKALRDIYDKF